MQGSFSDPGPYDAPWTYAIDWGTGQNSTGILYSGWRYDVTQQYCAPGTYSVLVSVTDKDGGTGTTTLSITVAPGSLSFVLPALVSLRTPGSAVIPATVLSTSSFNAPRRLDSASAMLGDGVGDDVPSARRGNGTVMTAVEDVNRDGLADLTLYFSRDQLVERGYLTTATMQLTLRAAELDGCTWLAGQSTVQVVP